MVIGIDASRANREKKTGTEWYSYHLIQELKKIDHENHYFLYSPNKLKGDLRKIPFNWQEKVLRWPLKYLWTQIRLSLEMIRNQPEILFIPAHALPLIHPKKSIITIHDLGFRKLPEIYSWWQRKYYHFVHWFAVKYADKIIVPSEFTKKELINLYQAKAEKIFVIPLGYDSKNFQQIQDDDKIKIILEKYRIRKPYLLFVGRLEKKKNLINLVEAFEILKKDQRFVDYQLVLVGKSSYEYNKIKSRITNCQFKSQIIEVGYCSIGDLSYIYSGAEIFIFPSLYEGFGLPLLEAMACGCPIIASAIPTNLEISRNSVLFFDPFEPISIVEAIKKIATDSYLREELIRRGLIRVKDFSWQKTAEKTLVLLK